MRSDEFTAMAAPIPMMPHAHNSLYAPELQPDLTGVATLRGQCVPMVKRPTKTKAEKDTDTKCAEPLPTLKAGREVGWFFLNGEAVAIERHECDRRAGEDS
jgi:hypothetical protein